MTDQPERLQKILSAYGIASRREAEKMIAAGRVSVNGKIATLGQSAAPGKDIIQVDGITLGEKDKNIYIMLNKPRGYLTTVTDDRGRNTVMDLLGDVGTRVYPVGRLDYDSEGLLILTNDGEFANTVAHPSNGKTKTYIVEINGDAGKASRQLCRPLMIDGRTTRAVDVKLISKDKGIIKITIEEGRKRIVRKMCAAVGVNVLSLRRVSIGNVNLGTLETGKWRYLTNDEVESLCKVEASLLTDRPEQERAH